jgi:hypothetical protein
MKTLIFTILTSLIFTFGLYSQSSEVFNPLLAPNDTAQQIMDIEKIYNNIKNNIDNFQLIEVFRDSMSFRDVYLKDNVLQLVKVQFIENKIEKNVGWYFLDSKLMYAESYWINLETKETVSNSKCYFSNLHMISWINDKIKIDSGTPEFKARETQLINYSKTLWVSALKQNN